MSPRKIGELIAERVDVTGTDIIKIEVAGPGFINFFLKPGWLNQTIFDVLDMGSDYGQQDFGGKRRFRWNLSVQTLQVPCIWACKGRLGDALSLL